MQFRDHPGVQGKRDAYPFDPRLLKVDFGYNPRNLDAPDERADLDELKESIRANGVRVPLEVRLVDEDVFVVAGHRRHKAVMELIEEGEEIKAVPVMPEPKHTSEIDRVINLVISNSGKPLKPLEVAEVVRRLVAFGWEKQQIAKRLGWKSPSTVTLHLDMIAMPEPVKEQVRDNVISATEAARVVKNLAPGTDPVKAAELIKANQEENKKIIGDKKRSTKVTRKTLERGKVKPEPKATPVSDPPEPEPKPDLPSALAATSETTPVQASSPLSDETPPQVREPMFRDADEAPPVHEQLQAAAARENGQTTVTALVSVDGGPITERVVTYPNRQAVASSEIQKVLGELSLIAEDNALGERDPDETLPIKVSLIARCDRLYRQMIGDTTADEAA